jgi:glycosyltransferase involved in cell wall biosynthesis
MNSERVPEVVSISKYVDTTGRSAPITTRPCLDGQSSTLTNESAPLVLVEAMLCGRPSVATDVGGIREWVNEPETGFIAEGISIESFQSALERAWSVQLDWESIGQRARAKAIQMLDPDPGGSVLNILLEVAAERRSGIQTELRESNHA